MKVGVWLLAAAWAVLLSHTPTPSQAQPTSRFSSWPARASYVVDGDSIWVMPLRGGARVRVRLDGIDAPEICQSGGSQAQNVLRAMLQGETLHIRVRARDRYGRAIATVVRQRDGLDVASHLVRSGWAWSDTYGWRRGRYWREEQAARDGRLGIFAAGVPERPADFRRRHGPCERKASRRKSRR